MAHLARAALCCIMYYSSTSSAEAVARGAGNMRDLDVQSLLFADDGRPYNQMDKIEVHPPIVDDKRQIVSDGITS
jgi:hypothetical protein